MLESAFNTERYRAYQRITELCCFTYQESTWADDFWLTLIKSPKIYEEWVYYINNNNFLGKYKISGYSIIDVFVWQINHFNRFMSGTCDSHCKGAYTLLKTFDFALKMEEDPDTYVYKLEESQGNDIS